MAKKIPAKKSDPVPEPPVRVASAKQEIRIKARVAVEFIDGEKNAAIEHVMLMSAHAGVSKTRKEAAAFVRRMICSLQDRDVGASSSGGIMVISEEEDPNEVPRPVRIYLVPITANQRCRQYIPR